MIEFVIGGTAQGKLKYVLDKNNLCLLYTSDAADEL